MPIMAFDHQSEPRRKTSCYCVGLILHELWINLELSFQASLFYINFSYKKLYTKFHLVLLVCKTVQIPE